MPRGNGQLPYAPGPEPAPSSELESGTSALREQLAPRLTLWAGVLAALALACGHQVSRPLSPREALQSFQVAPGFRVELFASEPHVVDPVEMAFDENGGVFVAELLDNPDDPPEGGVPLSRIKYLEDTDSDGVIDSHTVFADRLLAVEGIAPWRGGLVATAAPDILFLKDTDGDRRADVREVLYTGFALGHVEGRLSNPRLGMDNWFYVVNHGYPGEITAPARPSAPPVAVRNREFRFHPLRGLAQASTGNAQFGQTYNAWGHWFISHNTVHLRHTVVPPGYLERNPLLTVEDTAQDISDHGRPAAPVFAVSRPQQWRIDRTAVRQARYAETQPGRVERLAGFFTASCGATVYLGDAFPAEFDGRVFVGEGNGNLVHCDSVVPSGATYAASRWPADAEFLASRDNWFRPVNFANAPDGNLYVLDYYRQYLEHPDFIPAGVQQRLGMDFRAGDSLGRIFRVAPVEPRARRPLRVDLGSASNAELASLLEHPNGWHRRTAHRLLVERQDTSVAGQVRSLASDSPLPTARLRALWVLEGLGELAAGLVERALADPHPAVRENALRLAGPYRSRLREQVLRATHDESPRVAFQAALAAGDLTASPEVVEALSDVLVRFPEDRWFRVAVLSAPAEFAEPVLTALVTRHGAFFDSPSPSKQELVREFGAVIGARRRRSELNRMLGAALTAPALARPAWRAALLAGLATGLALHRGSKLSDRSVADLLGDLLGNAFPQVRAAAAGLARHIDLGANIGDAIGRATNEHLALEERIRAIRVLEGGAFDAVAETLTDLLHGDGEARLRTAAARALAAYDAPSVAEVLISGWDSYASATRDAVAELLIRRRNRARAFAEAIGSGRIDPLDIPTVTRIRFAQHPDAQVRARIAGRLALGTGERDAVVQEHLRVLEIDGAAIRGRPVFERECAACHLRRSARGRIGPDLSGVSNLSKETLLTSILDPSYAIEDRYRNHLLETDDGRYFDGILVAETQATVTLRAEADDVTILKTDIAELRASAVSLMPEGLEKAVSDQELADLIAYLQAGP